MSIYGHMLVTKEAYFLVFLGNLLFVTTMKTYENDLITDKLPKLKSSREWLEPQPLSFMEVS